MKNNPQQNEDNNAKDQFSNSQQMTFSQQTEFLKNMSNIEIKEVEATEVVRPPKITLYCCIWWENGGIYSTNPHPWLDKAEKYALLMTEKGYKSTIYKLEVDRPTI